MGDNIQLFDRNGVRTPMQWDAAPNAGFSTAAPGQLYAPVISRAAYPLDKVNVASAKANPASLFNAMRHMIAIRKQHTAFGQGTFQWANMDNDAIAAWWRTDTDEHILVLHNLTDLEQTAHIPTELLKANEVTNLLTSEPLTIKETITLSPLPIPLVEGINPQPDHPFSPDIQSGLFRCKRPVSDLSAHPNRRTHRISRNPPRSSRDLSPLQTSLFTPVDKPFKTLYN